MQCTVVRELPSIIHGFPTEIWYGIRHVSTSCVEKWTHPKAKTSDCLEKGSWSSAVSGESWRMISGARWQSQPLGMRSLSSLLLQRERKTNKHNPFKPSKLNPFYFPSCVRVSEACANDLPKYLWGKNRFSSRKKKLQSGVKVFNTNWFWSFTCRSVFISKWPDGVTFFFLPWDHKRLHT